MPGEIKAVGEAVSSFFEWLMFWNKTSATRNDKKSIAIAKKMARKISMIEINDVVARANFDEFVDDIYELKKIADKFIQSLD